MFVYLSKKIAVSASCKVSCIRWSKEHGTIATGTEDGVVKLIKETSPPTAPQPGSRPNSSTSSKGHLSVTQSLEGHSGIITRLSWNERYSKLMTADETGLIIVWVLYRGKWQEEMVTRSGEGRGAGQLDTVTGIKWSPDGELIAMLYSGHSPYSDSVASYRSSNSNTGYIIVGSVDGRRRWEKDFKANCDNVEWSPDGKLILVGILDIEIHVYDYRGEFMNKINVQSVAFDSIAITSDANSSSSQSDKPKDRSVSKNTYSTKVSSGDISKIVAIEWSNLFLTKPTVPTLAIAFESGRIQIMRNEYDDSPLVINSELTNADIAWNQSGNYLGVCGYIDNNQLTQTQRSDSHHNYHLMVKFFDPESTDKHLSFLFNTLRVPGKIIRGIDWSADSLKLSLAVDSCVMFANIRPFYHWSFFDDTCVFYRTASDKNHLSSDINCKRSDLIFWPLKSSNADDVGMSEKDDVISRSCIRSSDVVMKSVTNLIGVQAYGHYCIYASLIEQITKNDKRGQTRSSSRSDKSRDSSPDAVSISRLTICNTLGTPVDSTEIEFAIRSLAINSKFVIAAGKDAFIVWKFNAQNLITEHDNDLDNLISDTASIGFDRDKRRSSLFGTDLSTRTVSVDGGDILSVACSESILILALKSKVVNIYTLPKITLISNLDVDCHAVKLAINSDSTKLALIDSVSVINFYDLENLDKVKDNEKGDANSRKSSRTSSKLAFEKKDVWDMKWASDDPSSFALLERNKLIIYRDYEAEESGNANGYLASFSDLEIRTINLDQLITDTSTYDNGLALADFMSVIETRPLKDAREMIEKEGVVKSMELFEKSVSVTINNHPKIWRLLAKEALSQLNLSVAEHCFVRLKDYKSIQFIKRLSNLAKDEFKRAEVCAYFNDFDAAEKIYLDLDRKDLAIRLRRIMGQPLKMISLIKSSDSHSQVSDAEMKSIYSEAGDYLFDRFNYASAIKYYKMAENLEKMFVTYMCLEDFDAMSNLTISCNLDKEYSSTDTSSVSVDFKIKLARVFESVGMVKEAVKVYLSMDNHDDAVLACVRLNDWKTAIKLANDHHDVTDIDTLLNKYASHLMEKEKYFEIIELYRKASRIHDACAILLKIIDEAKSCDSDQQDAKLISDSTDLVLMKKLHTLIGILSFEEKSLSISERREQLQTSRSSRSGHGRDSEQDMTGPPSTASSSRSDLRSRSGPPSTASAFGRKKSLATLLASDLDDSSVSGSNDKSTVLDVGVGVHRTLDNPWRGSEAFHLMLLTQRLLHEGSERANELAIKCALRLSDYEDYLPVEDIYSLLALSALLNKRYDIASRAFIKLESASDIAEDKKDAYKELSLSIFSQHPPKKSDNRSLSKTDGLIECSYCETKIPDVSTSCPSCSTKFPFCTASGQSITDPSKSKSCQRCNHKLLINYDHVFNYNHCPLCHYCM